MSDTIPQSSAPITLDQKPATRRWARMFLWLFVMLILGGVLFFLFCPLSAPPHAVVEVAGQSEVLRAQIDQLTHRVEALEQRVASLNAAASAPAAVTAPAPEEPKIDPATVANLARAQSDIVALSSAMAALQAEFKATGASAAEARDTAATLIASAVAFLQLRDTAAAGHGFTAELATLHEAARNDPALQTAAAQLDPYVAGAPTLAALHEELLTREPAVAVAIAKGAAQNWWQRVVAELQGLITVRPVHGGEGDALAELDLALTKDGAAAALAAFNAIPADAQHVLADWQIRLQARQHIDEGIAAIAAHFTTLPAVKTP